MKWLAALPMILFGLGTAHADTKAFDAQMAPIAAEAVKIHAALFADTDKGVDAAAKAIAAAAAKLDPKTVTGEHSEHYAALPAKIEAAAKAIVEAKTLTFKREAFKDLSRPLAMWVTMSKPAGHSVGYCSMVKASWIQKGTAVQNPYAPKDMPGCGQIVGGEMAPTSAPTK